MQFPDTWVREPFAVLIVAVLAMLVVTCARIFRDQRTDVYKRGVVIIGETRCPSRRSARGSKDARRSGGRGGACDDVPISLAAVRIPFIDETKHFKLVGTTGTGKSTAIRELLGGALARGDRAIFADPDGGYTSRFFNRYRGDVVLNPFERHSAAWDPFAEIVDTYDVELLSSGLVPGSEDASSNEWRAYARTFLNAVLRSCVQRGRGAVTTAELWRLLAIASVDELRGMVAGTPAQPFLEGDNSRMFGSIRAVAVSAAAALEYVQAQRGSPFSVRRWVRGCNAPGALFIPYKASQIAALRSMIAVWIRLAIFEAMTGVEDRDQRLWFVIDELDALGAIEGLKDALARLRKFGGRVVLGFQSIAQVSGIYGASDAQTIVENCGNTLILRCSGSESGGTSQFASRLIGEREVVRRQVSRGNDHDGGFFARGARRSRNVSEQHVTEAAVMASQIEQLPDLCGYLKCASLPEWRKVVL